MTTTQTQSPGPSRSRGPTREAWSPSTVTPTMAFTTTRTRPISPRPLAGTCMPALSTESERAAVWESKRAPLMGPEPAEPARPAPGLILNRAPAPATTRPPLHRIPPPTAGSAGRSIVGGTAADALRPTGELVGVVGLGGLVGRRTAFHGLQAPRRDRVGRACANGLRGHAGSPPHPPTLG